MISYGNGVSLGPLDVSDCELIRSWRNQRAVWQWCRQNDLISDITQQGWYEAQNQDRSIHMYMIHSNGMKVGVCGLTSHCPNARRAEFSLYIAPEHQRNGYARAALKTLFTHGFKNLNLHSIWGESFDGNPAIELFRSLGMQYEGARRDHYFKDGKYLNANLFSILEHEWKG